MFTRKDCFTGKSSLPSHSSSPVWTNHYRQKVNIFSTRQIITVEKSIWNQINWKRYRHLWERLDLLTVYRGHFKIFLLDCTSHLKYKIYHYLAKTRMNTENLLKSVYWHNWSIQKGKERGVTTHLTPTHHQSSRLDTCSHFPHTTYLYLMHWQICRIHKN